MNEYEYKISVIVPVYNVERFIESCLDSLCRQTMDKAEMEVLLIDDGSTDQSLQICKMYANIWPYFKVFQKENSGVSDTRNLGIKCARGKYILFLDSDDMLADNTLQKVTEFFDSVYEEVDLVTYKIVQYRNGKPQPLHYRYDFLKKEGIYDLLEYPYITQTTMNIVVKNEKKIFFDTSLTQGEDQKYISENLRKKLKIGYCSSGEYKYIRHEGSAASQQAYGFYLYEQKIGIWEELFGKYEKVPAYIQSLLLANYLWEINRDAIFPYHYKEKEFEDAVQRIKNLLGKVDVKTIMNMPRMDQFHKHFWISMKENIQPTVIAAKDEIKVLVDKEVIYKRSNIEIVLNKVRIENKKLILRAFIKSPIFNYRSDEPKLVVVEDGTRREVSLFDSINSCYKTTMRTNRFFGFVYECDVRNVQKFYFEVIIDGIKYKTQYYCMPAAVFNKQLGIKNYFRENVLIGLNDNVITLDECNHEYVLQQQRERIIMGDNSSEIQRMRNYCLSYKNRGKIWLYSDSFTVDYDNAYYQFVSDFEKNDGIERWYVYAKNKTEIEYLFSDKQKQYLVSYGSEMHKLLYLCSEYIITSFSDIRPRFPFKSDAEFAPYADLFTAQTIYLQHGILHADLRFNQSAERCKVDKVVISSYFERDNYVKNYNYREEDLISVGMPRYDYIDKTKSAKNRILFAPSWRSYLVGRTSDGRWEKDNSAFEKSDYYKKFIEFLTSEKLEKYLTDNDLYLDAKLHQNMRDVLDSCDFFGDRINVVKDVEIEDYALFITDISSYVFDFAYLGRPIFYFMPDIIQFESGMNHYRKLDLPFEEAFGNLVLTSEDAVNELIRIAENQFQTEEPFKNRMANFYLPIENCCENLYQYLVK